MAAPGKFWVRCTTKLYGNYRSITPANHRVAWGKDIGLDMKKFIAEVDGGKYKQAVENEVAQGEVAGVQGTPSFFFNGRRYSGAFQAGCGGVNCCRASSKSHHGKARQRRRQQARIRDQETGSTPVAPVRREFRKCERQ